jgi:hypothetical protein
MDSDFKKNYIFTLNFNVPNSFSTMKQLSYLLIICMLWACAEPTNESGNNTSTTHTTTTKNNDNNTPPTKAEAQLLDQEKFVLKYPANWKINTGEKAAGELVNLISDATSTQDRFRETFSVSIKRSETQPFTLESFAKIIKKQLKKEQPNIKVIDEETKDGYFEMEYVGDYKDQKMKWRQRAWVKGKEAFVATYMADHGDFKNHEAEANLMMDSFKIK